MHCIAKESCGKRISLAKAERNKTYFCIECEAAVRMRAGQQRTTHFYHIEPCKCSLEGKSMEHIQIQLTLERHLPHVVLEWPFPTIDRIADVYSPMHNSVYEVQCSPISGDEVLARFASYESLGLKLVWILHDEQYNNLFITPLENCLRDRPYLYTNIDRNGRGIFYRHRPKTFLGKQLVEDVWFANSEEEPNLFLQWFTG